MESATTLHFGLKLDMILEKGFIHGKAMSFQAGSLCGNISEPIEVFPEQRGGLIVERGGPFERLRSLESH